MRVIFADQNEEQLFSCHCDAVPRIGELVDYVYSPDEVVAPSKVNRKRSMRYEVLMVIHVLHGFSLNRDEQIVFCVVREREAGK